MTVDMAQHDQLELGAPGGAVPHDPPGDGLGVGAGRDLAGGHGRQLGRRPGRQPGAEGPRERDGTVLRVPPDEAARSRATPGSIRQ